MSTTKSTTLYLLFIILSILAVFAHEESHGPDTLETTIEDSVQSDEAPTKPSLVPQGPVRCLVCSSDPRREGQACITRPRDFLQDCVTPHNSVFGPYTGCRRIEQWVDYDLNSSDPLTSNYHRIIRQCAYFGNLKKPCQKDNNLGGRQHVCYCQGEGCNSALVFRVDVLTIALFLVVNIAVIGVSKALSY